MAEDKRDRRSGITQMGDAKAGNLVMFTENARIEDSGLSVAELRELLDEIRSILAIDRKRKRA